MRARQCAGVVTVALVITTAAASPGFAQSSCSASGPSCAAPDVTTRDPTTLIGMTAPSTTGKNLLGRGSETLDSLLGEEPTAVVFWLNTCPHCRAALLQINRLRGHLGSGKQVVTAAIDARRRGPKGFTTPAAAVKTMHLKLPTILVANNVAMSAWQVNATPIAFIIDSSKTVRQVLQPTSSSNLASQIRSALAETN